MTKNYLLKSIVVTFIAQGKIGKSIFCEQKKEQSMSSHFAYCLQCFCYNIDCRVGSTIFLNHILTRNA